MGATKHQGGGATQGAAKESHGVKAGNLTTIALVMMNVTIIAGLANDVQQAFYGLTSVTYFILGAVFFFLPTGLVAAELASGWSERGGIFRWVGEGVGKSWAFVCIFILWFQTTFLFGANAANFTATIGFYGPDFDWAVSYAQNPVNEIFVLIGWLVFYWFMCWVATKGIKAFSRVAKYGVVIGTLIPLATMTVLAVVWLAQGHHPNIEFTPEGLIPKWEGMTTLALAAGVFFSFAGIDMNAAHIKQLKNPGRQYPTAIFIAMILSLLIFIVGTLIIAMVIPNKDLNVLYSLFATYRDLGATIGFPDLYMLFVYLGLGNTMANLITNLAGPSLMLGQAGRSGFLPKFLQNENKHGMPSRLMYFQMALMTCTAFVVFLLPNVEGFVVLVTQAITVLYLIYYILMFVAFLRLKYQQPNRPRTFSVPGGKAGAWIVGGVGIAASCFGIVLAIYPPAQIAKEVGSPVTYVTIILVLLAVVLLISFGIYFLSRKRNWVDPNNAFAPFTWEIEGLKKPRKVLSNIPCEMMSEGQAPMGMPIKRPYDPDKQMDPADIPPQYLPHKRSKKGKGESADTAKTGDTGSAAGATAPAASGPTAATAQEPAVTPATAPTTSAPAPSADATAAVTAAAGTVTPPSTPSNTAGESAASGEKSAAPAAEASAQAAEPATTAPATTPAADTEDWVADFKDLPSNAVKAAEAMTERAKQAAQEAVDAAALAKALENEADADLKLEKALLEAEKAQEAVNEAEAKAKETKKSNGSS